MSKLLNSLSSDNLVLLCVIMGIIALFLAAAISIEIYNSNKRYQKLAREKEKEEEEKKLALEASQKLNIKESSNIKYVEEDSELEKTKAKLELANLREKLKKEEEEKQKLIEMNLALANMANEKKEEVKEEVKEEKVENNETTVVNVENTEVNKVENKEESVNKEEELEKTKEIILDAALNKLHETKEEEPKKTSTVVINNYSYDDIEVLDDDYDDEANAIISYDELKETQDQGYTDDEMDKYVDEKDAVISIQELEKLYLESQNIEVPKEEPKKVEFEMKRVEDLPEIADNVNFQNSEFISPVFGITKNDQEIVLEQTANLEKLNDEIRKTNEFLKTLKDLKKNLE